MSDKGGGVCVPQARDYDRCVLQLLVACVLMEEEETAGGDVYCTANVDTTGTEDGGRLRDERDERGTKKTIKRQTNRQDERDRKRIMSNRRRTVSGYNPKVEEWGDGGQCGGKESPHRTIRQEPRKPEMRDTGDGPERRRKRGPRAVCKTKRKVW